MEARAPRRGGQVCRRSRSDSPRLRTPASRTHDEDAETISRTLLSRSTHGSRCARGPRLPAHAVDPVLAPLRGCCPASTARHLADHPHPRHRHHRAAHRLLGRLHLGPAPSATQVRRLGSATAPPPTCPFPDVGTLGRTMVGHGDEPEGDRCRDLPGRTQGVRPGAGAILPQSAVAGVEELQNRALQAEAKARLSAAPAPAAEPAPNMDSITKTLVMAQRTADATLADARDEADGIRKEASERAESILAEAKAQGAQMIAAAEQEALRTGEVTRSKVAAEVEALEARRSALSDDVDALSSHVTTQREQLASTVLVLNQASSTRACRTSPSRRCRHLRPTRPASRWCRRRSRRRAAHRADGVGRAARGTRSARRGRSRLPRAAGLGGHAGPDHPGGPARQQGEPQAWSFFDEGPKGDDRWKK